jgi:hypothetical protein
MQRAALQVLPAAEIEQRLHTRAPDRHLDEALAPRPPERVGHDDGDVDAEARHQARAESSG